MKLVQRNCGTCGEPVLWDREVAMRMPCNQGDCDGWAVFEPLEQRSQAEHFNSVSGYPNALLEVDYAKGEGRVVFDGLVCDVAEVGCHDGEPGQYYGYDPYNHVGRLALPLTIIDHTVRIDKLYFTLPDGSLVDASAGGIE